MHSPLLFIREFQHRNALDCAFERYTMEFKSDGFVQANYNIGKGLE